MANAFLSILRRTGGLFACLALLLGTVGFPAGVLAKEEPLKAQLQAGLGGKTKEGAWYPVQITLTNPGDDLEGELALQLASSYNEKDVAYVAKVDLPKGGTKVVTMTLPPLEANPGSARVIFYKGGATDGKNVPFEGGAPQLQVERLPQEGLLAGVLARDPDTMNTLTLLNQKGLQTAVVPFTDKTLPADAMQLDGLDLLILNDYASDQLKPEQVQAIEGWVGRGGKLILAGGAGYAKTAAPFDKLSPVTAEGTAVVPSVSSLEAASGKPLPLGAPLTVTKSALRQGAVASHSEGGLPLIASKPYGKGQVWFAAYDLSLQPIASWNGHLTVWESALHLAAGAGGQSVPGGPGYGDLSMALESFPSLAPPSFGILMLVLVLYAVVIGPLLYSILKRLDKREWAWGVIPLIAIVCSLGIYGIGASGRGSVMSQTLAIVELDGQGRGTTTSATGIFVPKGGNYAMNVPGGSYVSPLLQDNGMSPQLTGKTDLIVDQAPDRTALRFQGVSYWSVRKVWMEEQKPRETGSIGYTLKSVNGVLEGEIVNNTGKDLEDVALYLNGQARPVGTLKAGGKAAIGAPLNGGSLSYPSDLAYTLFPSYGQNGAEVMAKRGLLNAYVQKEYAGRPAGESFVIGFTDRGKGPVLDIEGKAVGSELVEMYAQPVAISMVYGDRISILPGTLQPSVTAQQGGHVRLIGWKDIEADKGTVLLDYRLPELPEAVYEKLTLRGIYPSVSADFAIWNENKQSWEPLSGPEETLPEPSVYIMPGGIVRVKAEVRQMANFPYPDLGLEGAVKR
ncbi:hypothetical protein J31TS4_29180 [Paenibacillus sp. J31TS4]|uniref:DUF7408 domain-containing protein n=1 Tax=Paenibacillus sp. J31TS4 TaxID=2807195 RepID=UPI001B18C921|nr:hypothetical protein [Paenibacillus sp. J31TS4]GIP39638.1 hypothetical protein J31TS4_29180 [Paenibacillus sp. J31TS4]